MHLIRKGQIRWLPKGDVAEPGLPDPLVRSDVVPDVDSDKWAPCDLIACSNSSAV
jgi:hypothetical protein